MVILVVFKVFLVVKNLEKLIQILPERPIYYYLRLPQKISIKINVVTYEVNSRNEI